MYRLLRVSMEKKYHSLILRLWVRAFSLIVFFSAVLRDLLSMEMNSLFLVSFTIRHFAIAIFSPTAISCRIHLSKTLWSSLTQLWLVVVVLLVAVDIFLISHSLANSTFGNGIICNMGNETGGLQISLIADLLYNDLEHALQNGLPDSTNYVFVLE